jgi:hypothetical protein
MAEKRIDGDGASKIAKDGKKVAALRSKNRL